MKKYQVMYYAGAAISLLVGLCTFPAFFKLNGQYIDFDLMNRDMR